MGAPTTERHIGPASPGPATPPLTHKEAAHQGHGQGHEDARGLKTALQARGPVSLEAFKVKGVGKPGVETGGWSGPLREATEPRAATPQTGAGARVQHVPGLSLAICKMGAAGRSDVCGRTELGERDPWERVVQLGKDQQRDTVLVPCTSSICTLPF